MFSLVMTWWCARTGELTLSVRVDLTRAQSRAVAMHLTLHGHRGRELRLSAPFGPAEVVYDDIVVRGADDRPIDYDRAGGANALTLTPPDELPVTVSYSVRFPSGTLGWGELGEHVLGHVGGAGCALPLDALVLRPHPRARVDLDVALPDGWVALAGEPWRGGPREALAWRREVLVAGPCEPRERALGAHGAVHLRGVFDDQRAEDLDVLVQRLERDLGPPWRRFEVLLLPPSDSEVPTALETEEHVVALDLRGSDYGSLRRFLRRVVPMFWGHRFRDLDRATDPRMIVPLGVVEYLAHRLPVECGFVRRPWAASLEARWFDHLHLAFSEPATERGARIRRRLAGAVYVHERVLTRGEGETLASILRGPLPMLGLGPREQPRLEAPSFVDRWRLPVERDPDRPRGGATRRIQVLITADLGGALYGCGCRIEAGGAPQRASKLAEWRGNMPTLIYELGGLYKRLVGANGAVGDSALNTAMLVANELTEYTAIVPHAEDQYPAPGLRGLESIATPKSAIDLSIDGNEPWGEPIASELDDGRGGLLRVGFFGYAEHLDFGGLHDPEEHRFEGVEFPSDPSSVVKAIEARQGDFDLVIVGGHMRPESVRYLAASGHVDLILAAGVSPALTGGHSVGYLDEALVCFGGLGGQGFRALELFLAPEGIVDYACTPVFVESTDPVDWSVDRAVRRICPERAVAELSRSRSSHSSAASLAQGASERGR
ncbi:MAG: hypothetical protein GY711_03110 [bacterium]|nr:hypothetical protein [bacterium]